MTGKMIDGREAERISLINRAVPADKLETEVKELANGIALHSRDGLAIAKATRHAVYESMGLGQWFNTAYWSHTLITNMRWEPDELNFFKQRRDKGVTEAAHEKQEYYKALDR